MLVPVAERARAELLLWVEGLAHLERMAFVRHLRRPDLVLECDASATAVAAIPVHIDGGGDFGMGVIHRELNPWERRSSSGLREMLGYAHAVKTIALREGPRLRGKVVEIVGDS